MFAAPKVGRLLSLVACCLVVAASGDDFNFARLVLPSMFSSGTSLPLDDPNADFDGTLNEGWGPLPVRGQENPASAVLLPSLMDFGGPDVSHFLQILPPCRGSSPRTELNPPLLC